MLKTFLRFSHRLPIQIQIFYTVNFNEKEFLVSLNKIPYVCIFKRCPPLKRIFLKISQKFTRKHVCWSLLFNKVARVSSNINEINKTI